MKLHGVDDLYKSLDSLAKKAEALHGQHAVPLEELLSTEFMQTCSRFINVESFFTASGFKFDNANDFEKIPEADLDFFVSRSTNYESWAELLQDATRKWASKKLRF